MVIDPTARIECDEFVAGPGLVVRANAEIYGRRVVLGRNAFIDEYAVIGGGSAGDLTAGDFLHVGMFAQVNTARPVTLGDEVGIGIGSRVFTHGAWLSELDGFPCAFGPVSFGSRVWLPNAVVLPGVSIGDDVVVAAGSVVTSDLQSGVLAGGSPARVLREGWTRPDPEPVLARIAADCGLDVEVVGSTVLVGETVFDCGCRTITGPVSSSAERMRNELRRHGVRFRFEPVGGRYEPWR